MTKNTISAVVLYKDEEDTIDRCIRSLSWCDEIVLIDDYSTGKKLIQIKESFPSVKVFKNHLNDDFASQRNYGLTKSSGLWILFIDADELVCEKLKLEILSIIKNNHIYRDEVNGYFIPRLDNIFRKKLKHGETAKIRLLRLGRKGKGIWKGKVHEVWEIKGEKGLLEYPISHYPHPTISAFLKSINRYTDIRARNLYVMGKKTNIFSVVVYPLGKFIYNFIFRLGFLDGMQGFVVSIFMSFHSFLVRSKLWMLRHNNDNE